jgi:carbon storage regulator
MLVLSRKESEKIMLGDSIVLTIVRVSGDRVRLGIEAPSDMLILRKELDPTMTDQPAPSNKKNNSDQTKAA